MKLSTILFLASTVCFNPGCQKAAVDNVNNTVVASNGNEADDVPADEIDDIVAVRPAEGGMSFEFPRSVRATRTKFKPSDHAPPISSQKAIALGHQGLEQLTRSGVIKDEDDWFLWEPYEVALCRLERDVWYWKVVFEKTLKKGGSSGMTLPAEVVVLMDGSLLFPSPVVAERR